MHRCLQLAAMGAGKVAPNPMVGAVLVFNGKIIGEGYHEQYGAAHAEVNCINSVADPSLIPKSTLYVSLEPCAHYGKTAPCADLIINNKIPGVVIGCYDSFTEVNGKGIEKLQAAGVNVTVGILENDCREINRRFFTFHENQRPFIILKWAQTCNGKIAPLNPPRGGTLEHTGAGRLLISNEITNRLVHKWRSEEAAILVGTNTAMQDDPALTTRLWPGKDPLRLVIDKQLKLPLHLKLFDGSVRTMIFNYEKQEEATNLFYCKLDHTQNFLPQVLNALYKMQVQSVLVEGGANLLQSFINESLWDEARVITNTSLENTEGLDSPVLKEFIIFNEQKIQNDRISFFRKNY